MTLLEIVDLMERVLIYYPHASIQKNERTVHAWHDILGECDNLAVIDKFKRHIKAGNKFPPTVAEMYVAKTRDTIKTYKETQQHLRELEERNKTAANFTPEQKETVNLAKQRIESILYQQQTNE